MMRYLWSVGAVPIAAFLAFAVAQTAETAALRAPFGAVLPVGSAAAEDIAECPPAPPPIVSLGTQSRYDPKDPTKSNIDDERQEAYDAAVKPLRDFQSEIVGWANDSVRKPEKTAKAACALIWLSAWAAGDALKDLSTNQAEFNRDQALSALGLSYLAISGVAAGDAPAIKAWLSRRAAAAIAYYDQQAGQMSRANNHRSFAALGVAAAAIANNDAAQLNWSMESLRTAICTADASGALPLEMKRGKRARDYQIFALGPLIMLAEIAERNGMPAYAWCDGALHRIVAFALSAIEDPSAVERLAGETQIEMGAPEKLGSRLAWLAPYAARFPETPWRALLGQISRPSSTALGGNLSVLFPGDYPGPMQ